MLPKKKTQAPVGEAQVKSPSRLLPSVPAFKDIVDGWLKDQMKELNAIVLKSNRILHDELKVIQNSLQFTGNKFDDLRESFRLLKEENQLLKVENTQLKSEVSELNTKLLKLDEEQENINLCSRRDCLEFHGIPQQSEENTELSWSSVLLT